MTFFFNLENLEKESCNDTKKFLDILNRVYNKKYFNIKHNMRGISFLLNPAPLFSIHKSIDTAYIVQYVKLAGRRDYSLYKHYGIKSLPLSYFPDINMSAIKTNPLLKITNTEIYFLYEEQGKNKWH
jgi:hypothetical protein